MANRRVQVLDSVGHAVQFMKASVRPASGVLAALAVAAAFTQAAQLQSSDAVYVLSGLAYLALAVMANAALFRLAFAGEHPSDSEFRLGPRGLQWSKIEWRLLGAMLLLALMALLAVLTLILVLSVAGVAAGISTATAAGDPTRLPGPVLATAAVGVLIAGAMLWAAVRLCLYMPATVAEKQVRVFSTWRLTKGEFWPILAAILLASLPSLVLELVMLVALVMIRGPDLKGAMPVSAALVIGALFGVVTAFVQMPLTAGLMAEIYRRLRDRQGVAGVSTYV